ncbi:hypothetical protein, unlikely [Trypanosoma brucei gambiense DAL972]|uniref:Uncharacterized protein n=1 Tax=Trypanosoma brucei gambiense (strain MHOM/CI/86/DAL972) TaxID=679716 RepID=C9ZYW8_TRYB9|nr:hypothetical protein, unlikely [Trypanosoma brucei gambiense DAL972]CBH14617.1 hypothetical protein, unlikely [Trypanosoma brucei gambiense DAL972]|eukprot:XP_011776883.1 hypothetical protein, unlikely [Trypanosoma brucei gambiense DAL972]
MFGGVSYVALQVRGAPHVTHFSVMSYRSNAHSICFYFPFLSFPRVVILCLFLYFTSYNKNIDLPLPPPLSTLFFFFCFLPLENTTLCTLSEALALSFSKSCRYKLFCFSLVWFSF